MARCAETCLEDRSNIGRAHIIMRKHHPKVKNQILEAAPANTRIWVSAITRPKNNSRLAAILLGRKCLIRAPKYMNEVPSSLLEEELSSLRRTESVFSWKVFVFFLKGYRVYGLLLVIDKNALAPNCLTLSRNASQ